MRYVKVEMFIFLVLDYTGQLGSKKIHSLLIGCNNLVTNLKVPGEFSQPKPTRFGQRFCQGLKPYGWVFNICCEMLVHFCVIHIPAE